MPGTQSHWIHEMSHVEVADYLKTDDIALIPFGATEQHGAHAPMMLDTAWAIAAAEGAARKTNVLIAPPVHYGWSYSHMGFGHADVERRDHRVPGTRSLPQPAQIGRASCRERVCQYVRIAVVAVC